MREAIVVFAKPAEPGQVKTRLVPPLSADDAAELYGAFVRDTAESLRTLGLPIRWYVSGAAEALPVEPAPGESVHPQRGEGLGARMRNAVAETVADGFERCVIVGTDSPTLPAAFVAEALRAVRPPRQVVLGPAEDGGYYLIALSSVVGAVFREIPWSTDRAFEVTCDRVAEAGLSLTVLPSWFDVDEAADLSLLRASLVDRPDAAPQTRQAVARMQQERPELFGGNSDIPALSE